MKLILLGAPGAGKGTQAEVLSKKLGVPTISTGNILRAAVKNGTPIGLKAKAFMDAGALVPDEVIIGIMGERLAEADCAAGYILDGMPRTLPQAEALEAAGVAIDTALSIEISDDEIIERMSGRRSCPSCGATFHVKHAPPKAEDVCDTCGGGLTIRKDDEPERSKTVCACIMRRRNRSRAFMPSAAS
jgi:adenylate kinase